MLPSEVYPENGQFLLSENVAEMNKAIEASRGDQHAWPKIQYLWQLHPVMQWLNDKVLSHFGRHQAPILRMPQHLSANTDVFLLSAVFPNRKSHPVINDWTVITFENGEYKHVYKPYYLKPLKKQLSISPMFVMLPWKKLTTSYISNSTYSTN